MNPPAALHGAMSRDRKPFTYTPGGLDLSEIKSSRMAARLMRNAMNEGVPEIPKQSIQSPPMPSTPIAVPNFNCLPVQVFPTFNLPANPKSLLRTRSNPAPPRDLLIQQPIPQASQFVNNSMSSGATQYDTLNINMPVYSQVNNNRPVSMFEYAPAHSYTPKSNENDDYTSTLPEISYDVEYFRAPPRNNISNGILRNETNSGNITDNVINKNATNLLTEPGKIQNCLGDAINSRNEEKNTDLMCDNSQIDIISERLCKPEMDNKDVSLPIYENNNYTESFEDNQKFKKATENKKNETLPENKYTIANTTFIQSLEINDIQNNKPEHNYIPAVENKETIIDILSRPTTDYSTFAPETKASGSTEDFTGVDIEKKEVKIVEKQVVKNKTSVENLNGSSDQNGDSEVDAVIKLPSKKSAAKTETKVEVTKNTLPDGSIEEVKKTITKTTIDGKTEIRTKTETTIIPKEDNEDEEEELEEEEENAEVTQEKIRKEPIATILKKSTEELIKATENGRDNIIKTEERSETTTTTTKKVVVMESDQEEEKEVPERNEEVEDTEPVTFVMKQPVEKPEPPKKDEVVEQVQQEDEEEEEEEEEEIEDNANNKIVEQNNFKKCEDLQISSEKKEEEEVDEEEVEEEEEYEQAEEKEITPKESSEPITESKDKKEDIKPEAVEATEKVNDEQIIEDLKKIKTDNKQEQAEETMEEKQEVKVEVKLEREIPVVHEETLTPKVNEEQKVPLREPSVPLEKVEDVEIKPIGLGDYLTKTSTEKTEIITNVTDKPTGLLTEYNRIENIVTVNRTTKTLDRAYEDITQQGIPTLKTYFTPHIDKISVSPQPTRPYQSVYTSEPTTERRHSLLLERLSVERQMPSDIYQNNYQYSNQTIEQQRLWPQEPQAEVLTVSNVKPSQITNQQWYQQKENAVYNNVAPSSQPTQAAPPSWTQPKQQAQPLYSPQSQYHTLSPQPQYQAPQPQYQAPQPQYQAPQPQYQAPQPQYQAPQPQYQASQSQSQAPPLSQYQPSHSENIHEKSFNTYQNTYSTYTPKPTSWATSTKPVSPIPTIITTSQPSEYNYINKDMSESYQQTTQQYSSSSYVPPPWEQDPNYVPPEIPHNFYQSSPQTNSFSPDNKGWKPNLPTSKFSKPPPKAYIPPKPNQSFVAPVSNVPPPKTPGRKTYYSEYERRYISVPESTYIPGENKYQHQPDPSPAYYYDNNEPSETVEPQWRRELREFTEKSQTQTTTTTSVKPPWEANTKYAKDAEPSYTQTPTWSQTVRPQSWRERSFESEFVSQEWPKTNTLGRGRPLSSYGKESIPERTRGVSVDRYNPNSYQAPVAAEHPPVQTHTHVPPAPHATGYHNPNVPAYHARASAEPREQVSYQQPRNLREVRASPIQSRSFKYLQWITGTED